MALAFISYRHVEPDQALAEAIHAYLRRQGIDSFLDRDIPLGADWDREIGSHLRNAEFFIVLLSEETNRSEAVQLELEWAHEQMRAGRTRILPVRFRALQQLTYGLAIRLARIQYVTWDAVDGHAGICQQLHAAITGRGELPIPGPEELPHGLAPYDLGAAVAEGAQMPSADLRIVEAETGAVPLDSAFYIETALHREIAAELSLGKGRTIVIRGARQSGKSTHLLRAHDQALRNGQRSWLFSFQEIDDEVFDTLDSLLRNLADRIEMEFATSVKVRDVWNPSIGSKTSFTHFVERAVAATGPVAVFCWDEIDLVFPRHYSSDFFKTLRVWHNSRAPLESPWRRVTMVLSHATDPNEWIKGTENSPFNVAHLNGELLPFERSHVVVLDQRYGTGLTAADIDCLMVLVGGQPYLIRQALCTLKKGNSSMEALAAMCTRRDGPFADHLRAIAIFLSSDPQLTQAMRQIVGGGECNDENAFHRLVMAGLVEGESRRRASCRCEIYRRFVREHL